ncbi:MAG TPA: YfcE family phosphodiesterase [Desulfobulbaceae bacterium]|nr:YfcE family phosphodiesterase [Desulfobulbaceae bacterium]
MHIAIISDSHDHIPNLVRAVNRANKAGAEVLIHCGDLISPFMLPYLHRFHGQIHLIYGNNAGDQHLISSRCATLFDRITHHGFAADFNAAGLRIGCHHYPELARGLAASGQYDMVCCGHNHKNRVERIGDCLLVNPGDLLGKDELPGFILLATEDLSWKRIIVGKRLDIDNG